ncbi:MAG: protein-ADP-ribose hydrolase [Lachnospiraceae bacterium]|uniref:Protein-ADP-ribose hydrolase n=1 Tax=Hominifimenecus microfluidus TaxID=2885348 RepID=A0AAE3JFC6_9FIRM|nr:protein-ADP-ribose hydrolase [Hominifimenecus microfluidus]MCC2231340.1 protein-ADP-ribose hydrolase [Hominifimenecus microfluidus]
MNQPERRRFLIEELLRERNVEESGKESENKTYRNKPGYTRNRDSNRNIAIPTNSQEQKQLLRALMNLRPAAPVSEEFRMIQDEYLQAENTAKGIVTLDLIPEVHDDLYLWQGDITRLKVGAIVNAANSGMTGCYQPCHACIDNCIHTYAGIELRNYCQEMMDRQGFEEPTGQAKITPAFNLPCDYVIHTVGPIVQGALTKKHERLLRSCYESCLQLAVAHEVKSIAFCCISTGVFHFPNQRAAEIAVHTVEKFREKSGSDIAVIFNVFKDSDREIYRQLLQLQ